MSYKTEATKERLAKLLEIQKQIEENIFVPNPEGRSNDDDLPYYKNLYRQYQRFLDSLNLLIRFESFRLGNNLYDDENKKKGGPIT